ncbi:MAG: MlaD family protein [Sedimentisphaerales bacterium]|nr:MlaD family protein [Sedimentisphaerales bacterium]
MSDYETMQRRRSMVVGVFVVVAVVAFFWLVFKFGDLPGLVSEVRSYEVRVQFPSAPGVQRDTPVRFCGYQIGRVSEIRPPEVLKDLNTGQYYHQAVVIISIDNQFNNIPVDAEAKLMTRGLGSSYIELRIPPRDIREGRFLSEGSLLQGTAGMTSEFFPEESQKKLDDLITGITAFVNNTNDIVGDAENKANIKAALANLAKASQQATEVMKELGEMSAVGKTTLQNVDARMERLTSSLVGTSEKLSEAMKQLDTILTKVNNGDGTAGKLINDGRLYEQLLEDSKQLDLVLQDLKSFVDESKQKGVPIKLK